MLDNLTKLCYCIAKLITQLTKRGGEDMSEKEKTAFAEVVARANELSDSADEGVVLAITASYLAGKEAGKREKAHATQPGT